MTPPRIDDKKDYLRFSWPVTPLQLVPVLPVPGSVDLPILNPNPFFFQLTPISGTRLPFGEAFDFSKPLRVDPFTGPDRWPKIEIPPPPPPGVMGSGADWIKTLRTFGNQIERLDLDFYNLPVNRGLGLCRFSEFTPRAMRPEKCTISINPGTKAKAHGEIRPVGDGSESMITRVMWDFDPNVLYLQDIAPNLEIDGASAVDPPIIQFDRTWPHPKKIVKSLSSDNDLAYENPISTGAKWATPFDSTAPAPPKGHNYWMFHFQPVDKNLISGLEESISEGSLAPTIKAGLGGLYLWAFLPELGLTQDDDFTAFGVPFNTFPRKFGDLLGLLGFLFDAKTRTPRLQSAPLINPNTEYIDDNGARLRIPEDVKKVEALNEVRRNKGQAELGRNRGGIIDWGFTELAKDVQRLRDIKDNELPYGDLHFRLRGGVLELPIGKIRVDSKTDFKLHYYLKKVVTDDPLRPEGKLGMRLEIENFRLEGKEEGELGLDLKLGSAQLTAKSLVAKKAIVDIPDFSLFASGPTSAADFIEGGSWKKPGAATYRLEGVEAKDLRVQIADQGMDLKVATAGMESLELIQDFRSWKATLTKFSVEDLRLGLTRSGLPVQEIRLPSTLIPKTEFSAKLDVMGRIEKMSLEMPEVPSNVEVDLAFGTNKLVEAKLKTTGTLKDLYYKRELDQDGKPIHKMGVDLPSIKLAAEGGILKIPVQSTGQLTISDGKFRVGPDGTFLEGDLDLSATGATELVGFGRGQSKWGNLLFAEGSPRIKNVAGKGHFRFDFLKDGWKLSNPLFATKPLNFEFDMGIEFSSKPDLGDKTEAGVKESEIIKTEFKLDASRALIQDLREVGFRQDATSGVGTAFQAGALFMSGLKGSGKIWGPLPIWGYVRLDLPSFGAGTGNSSGAKTVSAAPVAPDAGVLVKQIPTSVMDRLKADMTGLSEDDILKKLKSDNFFLLSDVSFNKDPSGWTFHLGNLVANLHEQPKAGMPFHGSFGMVRVPEIDAALKNKEFTFTVDFKNAFNYIFMNEPDRGGNFCIVRWTEALPKASLCPTHK